ncbi:MAG: hypothetical protein J6S10_03865 [Clostridia bacterium]|nr:hypothetical protein [Clostridia bacterium]MBO7249944.1 hypothetical protein [Clostridia bacterium]
MSGAYFFKVCAMALVSVTVGAVIKLIKGELSFAVKVAGALLGFGLLFLSLREVISSANSILNTDGFSEYAEVILKSLGVAFLTHIASSVCKDCGEQNIASVIEIAGKVEILLLSLPMVERLLKYTAEISALGS